MDIELPTNTKLKLKYVAEHLAPKLPVDQSLPVIIEQAIEQFLGKEWRKGPYHAVDGLVYYNNNGSYRLHDTEDVKKPHSQANAQRKAFLLNERWNTAMFETELNIAQNNGAIVV